MAGIDWTSGPDAAFEAARASGLPVLLYWGAVWCPPCNRSKAGVFGHPRFTQLAARFVALHIDGDAPGAQQLAERFAVRSYPTFIVFRPDGSEITRLPCEAMPERFLDLLELALSTPHTAAASLGAALSGERALSDDEWRLLAWYSWDTDEKQLLKALDPVAVLASLARACTLPEAALRLQWHGLKLSAAAGTTGVDRRSAMDGIEAALADPRTVAAQADIVTNYAVDLVRYLAEPGTDRVLLANAFAQALAALEEDGTLDMADQLAALRNRVRMARLGAPVAGLEQHARTRVAAAMAQDWEPAMRHTLLNTASGVLSDAGLLDEAEQLLLAELERSHAPYYFMHNLAGIARRKGDIARMLSLYEQAWMRATGPATRLQWGATCLIALVDHAPAERERIEDIAGRLAQECAGQPDAAFQRNRTQQKRIEAKLAAWRATPAL